VSGRSLLSWQPGQGRKRKALEAVSEPSSFGTAMRTLRGQRGVSLAKLSELVHYSKGHLSKIENGERPAHPHVARCCDEALCAGGELLALAADLPQARRGGLPRPAQLPGGAPNFVGRADAIARLDGLISGGSRSSGTVVITAIGGTAGVGKTALALHWAQRVKGRFPDGTLFANLRGYDPAGQPAGPGVVLDGFLRALAVAPEAIPPELESRSALLRTLLDGKRALILLDNAATPAQVRPLLPGSPGCLVLITSRSRLAGLVARDGAAPVSLGRLTEPEAILLLKRTLGDGRVTAEPAAAAEVARLCGYLPLALRIAADRAAARQHLTLADLARQLRAERDRLDVLAISGDEATEVRSVFSWSYRALPADAARMFRLLGLHRGSDLSVHAAAAAAGVSIAATQRLLDLLADAHLVDEPRPGRYLFHDLLRIYAAERARADESRPDRVAAVHRMLSWYLHSADAADRVLLSQRRRVCLDAPAPGCHPLSFNSYPAALEWCETERANLVAATRHAAKAGEHAIAWQLPVSLWGYFDLRKPWADWIACCRTGLAAARRAEDRNGEAATLNSLAGAYWDLRRFGEALDCYRQALGISHEMGDRRFEASCLNNIGSTYFQLRRLSDAADWFKRALFISRETGNRRSLAIGLNNLGETYLELGQQTEALGCLQQALTLSRAIRYLTGESSALNNLGGAYLRLGRIDDALGWLSRALALRREMGDRCGEAETLRHLGDAQRQTGHLGAALSSWRAALAILEDLGDPAAAELREAIGALERPPPGRAGPSGDDEQAGVERGPGPLF